MLWKMQAMAHRGGVLALVGKSADAIKRSALGSMAGRSVGATVFAPFWLTHSALAMPTSGKFSAWRK